MSIITTGPKYGDTREVREFVYGTFWAQLFFREPCYQFTDGKGRVITLHREWITHHEVYVQGSNGYRDTGYWRCDLSTAGDPGDPVILWQRVP